MDITQIETKVKDLIQNYSKDTFIYELLLAYNLPKASITRLKTGNYNISKVDDEISWKTKLYYKETKKSNLDDTFDDLLTKIKHDQRFIIVNDFKNIIAYDTKTSDRIDFEFNDLPSYYDFFLPWAGIEKTQYLDENPADVKAAEKMAKLFDNIKKDNPDNSPEFVHDLNIFISRLLFCFFAEDTNIFEDNQFTNAISSHTSVDGADLNSWFDKFFDILNTEKRDRGDITANCNSFPFVNGGLFAKKIQIPVFSKKSRKSIIDSGTLDWSEINPDIFGSMIQAVISPDMRGNLGMHYTSVPNIMKVIEPLFLNELYEVFEKAKGQKTKLNSLLNRLHNIKIFDPACGSGNFLIIAYKELRFLEMKILEELKILAMSEISLSQFYGIEIDDFAHEIAMLALWLAEHQMNVEFFKTFGEFIPSLPLKATGKIVHGNATRLDWEMVCPKNEGDEIYILGNPPYLGSKNLNDSQRGDIEVVFDGGGKILDYISIWFYKAAKYSLESNTNFAFVTTNSICQGEQVSILWSQILTNNLEIYFAYQSFKWENNAKNKAAVTVVIVGVRNKVKKNKYIFNDGAVHKVKFINPYLINGQTIYVKSKSKPFKKYPEMIGGNVAYDSGNLIFDKSEMDAFIKQEVASEKYFKKLIGGKELLNGGIRYCLWFKNYHLNEISDLPNVVDRLKKVKEARLAAKDKGTHKLALRPHQFRDLNNPETYIAIPKTSSERRDYIPMQYLTDDYIPADSIRLIPDAKPFLFGFLSSKLHMIWVKTISGRLKTDYRYSKNLSYNTFPFCTISDEQKEDLTKSVFRILEEREKHSEKTLAELYDPDKMPDGLREAHKENDLIIERCYRKKLFNSDEERLEYLFELYEEMIKEEEEKDSLFKEPKKTRKRK